jgi:anti-anti-sigma factor
VIELKDVSMLTSSGMRTLVRAWNWAVDRDETTLIITGASPPVRRIFEACGLLGLLWE